MGKFETASLLHDDLNGLVVMTKVGDRSTTISVERSAVKSMNIYLNISVGDRMLFGKCCTEDT